MARQTEHAVDVSSGEKSYRTQPVPGIVWPTIEDRTRCVQQLLVLSRDSTPIGESPIERLECVCVLEDLGLLVFRHIDRSASCRSRTICI